MAVNLTTRTKVKAFANINVDNQDVNAALDLLIDGVSEQVAEYCDRTFELQKYKRWVDGSGMRTLRLPEYPVTRLFQVTQYSRDAGSLTYTGGGSMASGSFRETDLSLTLTSISTSGNENFATINTSGKTMSALSTSIAAQSGWVLDVDSGFATFPASAIRPFTGWTKSTDDIDLIVPDESDEVRLCSRSDEMIEIERGSFAKGSGNVFCWFEAGYILPLQSDPTVGNLPAGLELVVNKIVKALFEEGAISSVLRSEKIGDYAYTVKDSDMIDGGAFRKFVLTYSGELYPYTRKTL